MPLSEGGHGSWQIILFEVRIQFNSLCGPAIRCREVTGVHRVESDIIYCRNIFRIALDEITSFCNGPREVALQKKRVRQHAVADGIGRKLSDELGILIDRQIGTESERIVPASCTVLF